MTISNYLEELFLKTLRGGGVGTNFTAPAAIYVKLHLGDPGEDGTANPSAFTTRAVAVFAAPVNPGGTMTSSANIVWLALTAAETLSYVSLWDAAAAGNCLWSGPLTTPRVVAIGDNFTIPAGSLVLTLA